MRADDVTGEPMDMPDDPFPDLTLIDLGCLKLSPELSYLRIVQRLFPGTPMVFIAEVVERTDQGAPHRVRLIP